jgi:hypothetical protein
MKNLCQEIYEGLLADIISRKESSHSHRQWIEDCFQLCFCACSRLQELSEKHRFTDQHEEIWFYKTVKPHFTAQIKYFTLLYASEVFAPEEMERRAGYWINEQKKSLEFFEKHEAFYQYYKKGMTNQDSRYFSSSSSHVDILASFIAREKYLGYLHTKFVAQPAASAPIHPGNGFFL